MMGRRSLSPSPILWEELENLDRDVRELDSNAVPLYEFLPQIDNIMATIIEILKTSEGSLDLHRDCSKVVADIARYGMDPATSEEKKRYIIHSLAKPLSDCLLATREALSSGAAICLKALVDSDNWRFATNEIVNEVCQTVAGALEKHEQTNPQMALVISLAKHNSLIVEAYARLLIQSGLGALKSGNGEEGDSRKRFLAILMINSLMRYLDPRSIYSELGMVIEELVIHQSDEKLDVRRAAFEALQLAKRIDSIATPQSQNPLLDSPDSTSINQRLWKRYEHNGGDYPRRSSRSSTPTITPDDLSIFTPPRNNSFHFHGSNTPLYSKLESARRKKMDRKSYVESSESTSPAESQSFEKVVPESEAKLQKCSKWIVVCGFLILVIAIFVCSSWDKHQDGGYNLVPT